jgi:Flp pilus assembly protein TadD
MISRVACLACLLVLPFPLRAQDAYQSALDSFHSGKMQLVLGYLDQLPPEQARTPAVQNLKALALAESDRYEEALAAIHTAQELDRGSPQYIYNEGLIHYTHKVYASAENVFRQGLKEFPASAILHQGLGETLLELHQFGDAELALKKAVSLAPASAAAHVVLAKLFMTLGDGEGLGEASRQALEFDPRNHLAHYYHGMWLLSYREQAASAATPFRKSAELYPSFSESHKEWGRALTLLDDWRQASACFERATTLNPKDPQAWYLLAMALRKTGEQQKASQALARYKETLRPNDRRPITGGTLRP